MFRAESSSPPSAPPHAVAPSTRSWRRVATAVTIAMALHAGAASALSSADADCRDGLAKHLQKYTRALIKEQTKCHQSRMLGKVSSNVDCSDTAQLPLTARTKLAQSEAKLRTKAVAACTAASAPLTNGYQVCAAPCDDLSITTGYDSVFSCLACLGRSQVSTALAQLYGTPPIPGVNTDEVRCQKAVGKAYEKLSTLRGKEQRSCQSKHDEGDIAASVDCQSADLKGKIQSAEEKAEGTIAHCQNSVVIGHLDSCGSNVAQEQACVLAATQAHTDYIFDQIYNPSAPEEPPLDCPAGYDCLDLTVQPGPSSLNPADDGWFSWFTLTNIAAYLGFAITNGTQGDFTSGPIAIAKGQTTDAQGLASLVVRSPVIVSAKLPSLSGRNARACFRIEQDPDASGWIDCNGGSNTNVDLSVDSHAAAAADQPTLTVGTIPADSGSGAAVLRVLVQAANSNDVTIECTESDFTGVPAIRTALTTGTAASQVYNVRQHSDNPTNYPNADEQRSAGGRPLDCASWAQGDHASLAVPLHALDNVPGAIPGSFDIAEVLRLEVVAANSGSGSNVTPSATAVPSFTRTPTPVTPTPTPPPANCPSGSSCAAFNLVPGPGVLLPSDDGVATWLRIFDFTGVHLFANATDGHFGPSPLLFGKGSEDGNGVAPLSLLSTAYLGANLVDDAQQLGQHGTICVRIQPDPDNTGWIDCNGGTNPNASLTVDSQLSAPPPPAPVPSLSIPANPDGSVAGAAVVRVLTQLVITPDNDAACNLVDYSAAPIIATAFSTGVATSTVVNDVIDGNGPQSAGPNVTALGGTPFDCSNWGAANGPTSSVAAPLFALDFLAPVVGVVVDVSQVFRLQLEPRSFPSGDETATPTRTATATSSATPSETPTAPASQTPTLSASPTTSFTPTSTPSSPPTATPTQTPTRTSTYTASTTPTHTPTFTPTATDTPLGPIVRNVTIVDSTSQFGPNYQAFGNCYSQGKIAYALTSTTDTTFTSRYQSNVATDCEAVPTGGGGVTATLSPSYSIQFDIACPANAPYVLTVTTSDQGAFTINRDNNDGCDAPFFGSTGTSLAQMSAITGSQTGGTLQAGGALGLAGGSLSSAGSNNSPFTHSANATITGTSNGSLAHHTLSFSWSSSCSSNGNSTDTGSECSVRFGLSSDVAPNGIAGCMDADDYPGVGGRDSSSDGHFVSLSASCGAAATPTITNTPTITATPTITPTDTPTITPGGPTLTPTPTITSTPTATATFTSAPLGNLIFSIVTGPGGSDNAPGCPGEPSSGSLLRTHGNPTGGVPGTVCNGTKGDFYTLSGPLTLQGGTPNASGVAALNIASAVVVGASLPGSTPNCSDCDVCWRIEQDASAGFVDCDGGSNADVSLVIDSNGSSAPPAPASGPYVLGSSNSGAGAAVLRAYVKRLRVSGSCPNVSDSRWNSPDSEGSALLVTGSATSRIDDRHQCSGSLFGTACPSSDPYTVTLSGTNLNCSTWAQNTGARFVVPFQNLDENIGGSFGSGDIAQVLRLND